jgi:hypothetical protein
MEILLQLQEKINKFNSLPIQVKRENTNILKMLKQQYNSIKKGTVYRGGIWHPHAFFVFKNECKSIKEYFDTYGDTCKNIVSIKPVSILDTKQNIYITL